MTKREALQLIDEAKRLGYVRQGIDLGAETRAAMACVARRSIHDWEMLLAHACPKKGQHCAGEGQPPTRFAPDAKNFGECPACGGYTYVLLRGPRRGQIGEHVALVDELGIRRASLEASAG